MNIDFYTKNKEIENILSRLTKYPVVKVAPSMAQTLSRHKKIRYLSKNNNIFIRKGLVALPPNVKLKSNGNGFSFDIF
jgi:hypothetical protein